MVKKTRGKTKRYSINPKLYEMKKNKMEKEFIKKLKKEIRKWKWCSNCEEAPCSCGKKQYVVFISAIDKILNKHVGDKLL